MGKTKAKWLNRDVADPDHVGAETLPFDAASTVKDKVLYVYSGASRIPDTEPLDEALLPRETVLWYDDANHVVRRKHKDASGAVRVMAGEPAHISVIKRSVNYTAVDGEVVVCIAPVYITLKNAINASITVKNLNDSGQVVVLPESGTIDGEDNYSTATKYASATFVCDGTDWLVI